MTDPADPSSLMHDFDVTEAEISARKAFLEFGAEDVAKLQSLKPLAQRYATPMIEDLYRLFLAHDPTKAFFRDPKSLERVKQLQKEYFIGLTEGEYGTDYVERRLKIGAVHERIKLVVKWYLGAYAFYLRTVSRRIFDEHKNDPAKALDLISSLTKLIFFDMGLAIDTYIAQREKVIRAQQDEIRELSTPVLRVRDRLLVVPIIGLMDSARAYQLTDQVLRSIRAHRAKVVVLDITGVPTVDSAVANHLIQTVQASRLLGARSIVTGVSPDIAQTLVRIGVDVGKLHTLGDLQEGLVEANKILDEA
ncbi:MAG TPA: protoglobin domain-containing protein [Planctomycetota bacterium]|nr:protoglobin domain-containing protein [Planctomycetota bacterium]